MGDHALAHCCACEDPNTLSNDEVVIEEDDAAPFVLFDAVVVSGPMGDALAACEYK